MRDSCEGCPAYENLPEEEKAKITGKVGVGKVDCSRRRGTRGTK